MEEFFSKNDIDKKLKETEKKLILLFVLDKMEIPLTEESIMDICTNRNGWLQYLDCKDALWQLLSVKFICKMETPNGVEIDPRDERYILTSEGRDCVASFYTRIEPKLREEIAEYAKQNRMVFKRNQEYVYEYFKNNDGTHTVVFRIKDPSLPSPLFEVRIKTPTRSAAINAGKKWHKNAPSVYEYIYEKLISDNN